MDHIHTSTNVTQEVGDAAGHPQGQVCTVLTLVPLPLKTSENGIIFFNEDLKAVPLQCNDAKETTVR